MEAGYSLPQTALTSAPGLDFIDKNRTLGHNCGHGVHGCKCERFLQNNSWNEEKEICVK